MQNEPLKDQEPEENEKAGSRKRIRTRVKIKKKNRKQLRIKLDSQQKKKLNQRLLFVAIGLIVLTFIAAAGYAMYAYIQQKSGAGYTEELRKKESNLDEAPTIENPAPAEKTTEPEPIAEPEKTKPAS